MKKKVIPYSRQCIEEDDIRMVRSVLESDYITQGPRINEFEEKLAAKVNCKYAVILNSGTAALHAAYFSAGIGPGDEIITSPLTFAATANAALYLGAGVVFADIEKDTGNLDPDQVKNKITEKTKGIVPVHYGGHPVDLEKFYRLATEFNVRLIEDASHALGASYRDNPVGNCRYSDLATMSFHAVKHITTGEGGVIFTNNEEHYEKMRAFRHHGIKKEMHDTPEPEPWYYEMHDLGYNYRITDIQAGLGISQLQKLDRFVNRRREIAARYSAAFRDEDQIICPVEKEYAHSSYHLYPIRLTDPSKRRRVFNQLRENNIWVQVHYIPVYLHPYYKNMGFAEGLCPNAEEYYQSMISIPVYPTLSNEEQDYVITLIKQFVHES